MDFRCYYHSGRNNVSDSTLVVGFRPQKGTTMKIVWKAELTDEMIAHLSFDDKVKIRLLLSTVVDAIAAEYKVGREFKHELRTTA